MNNKVADIITNKFLEAMKASGKLPWQKPWRSVAFRNAVSGNEYRGINVLILALFGEDTDFLTYKQAQDNGGHVRKGAKGLPITKFQLIDRKDDAGNIIRKANGNAEQRPMLRYSTVFNLSDIEGCDALKAKAAKRYKVITFAPLEACEKLLVNFSTMITHGGNRAYYSPAIHAITMPIKETFKSVNHYYATLFHEMGHSIARELGEDVSNSYDSDPYAKEELVAELFANLCLSYAGIDSSDLFDNSLAYFQSWTSRFMGDPMLLISASSKASKRFNWLLNNAGLADTIEDTQEAELAA